MARSIKNRKKAKGKNKGSKQGDDGSASMPAKVWQPGVDKLEEGEELQCDPSAYNSLHAFSIGWPCLSFDILSDSLGLARREFPHTAYFVAGTQAERASWNSIGICKITNISGKRRELVPSKSAAENSDVDSESSDSDEDSDDEISASGVPVLQLRKVSHEGCVNRIRAMPENPHICASWGDTGHVQIWDFSSHLNALAESETGVSQRSSSVLNQAPLLKFGGHKDEGYAIDWSRLVPGRLISGDCKNCIYLWEPASGSTWNVDSTPFLGHAASVEDLQWSPTQPNVFASCSVDGSIAIWDINQKMPYTSFKAHNADVNVLSWNRDASCMLASGCDDGSFSIHDLRMVRNMGSFRGKGSGRGGRVPCQDERAGQCPRKFAPAAPLRSPGAKGLEGTSLAQSDPRADLLHSTRWFQHSNAFQHTDRSSFLWFLDVVVGRTSVLFLCGPAKLCFRFLIILCFRFLIILPYEG